MLLLDFYTLKKTTGSNFQVPGIRINNKHENEMVHATQRNVVTGGGCDCDKAIYGKIMFDHIAIINIAVVLILILKIMIMNIITLKIMTIITLTMKTITIVIVGII